MAERKTWKMIGVALLLAGIAVTPGNAQPVSPEGNRGSIRVTVVDEIGNTVSGATAYAMPLGEILAMVPPQCRTNQEGTCMIRGLEYGKYRVTAAKPKDGYPQRLYEFYFRADDKSEIAILTADHESDSVVVSLGRKAGILTGTVADAVTGKPLNANVEFRWVSDPRNFFSGSGLTNARFRVLVPSNVAITMMVSRDGYEDWVYRSPSGSRAILLKPGQVLPLQIRMRPKPTRQATPAPTR